MLGWNRSELKPNKPLAARAREERERESPCGLELNGKPEPLMHCSSNMKDFPFLSLLEELSSNQEVNKRGGGDFLFLGLNQRAILSTELEFKGTCVEEWSNSAPSSAVRS